METETQIRRATTAVLMARFTYRALLFSVCIFASEISGASPAAPPLQVQVDPRVELMSVLFRLAGNPEYNQGRVDSYTEHVEKHFAPFREHEAVKLARQLRERRGVSFDACMSMAAHLRDVRELKLLVPLESWPVGLDRRWTKSDIAEFLKAARSFVVDASFQEFLQQHRTLYTTTEERLRLLMEKEGHLEWFQEFFGERAHAAFILVPGLLNGGACYGARCIEHGMNETLYCILGVWKTDTDGLPEFTPDMLQTVVHEFAHSHVTEVFARHAKELQQAGDALFAPLAAQMRSQAYGDGRTLIGESLVRACEVRYALRHHGAEAARRVVEYQRSRGFLWVQELSDLYGEYEASRDKYPTFEMFSPRIATFFTAYAKRFAEEQRVLASRRPKVVSLTPANGASEVDPNLVSIQVTFDRPMRDRSWSMVGGGPHFPETTGSCHYDQARITWTVPVKLKPGWDYEFQLNSLTYDSFRSEEGVPLEPVVVKFRTRAEH